MILYLGWFLASVLILLFTVNKSKEDQKAMVTYFLIALGIFVGLGDMLGGFDRYIYGELFDAMADVTHRGGNPWLSYAFGYFSGEFGYGTFCALLTYITGNRYIFIFIATMVIYTLLIISLRQYVDNAPFAVVMFMGLWFFFTFTYLRQVLGCTVMWLSVRYIINRNLPLFLLVWFIGFSFHNSCVMFLPMYWVPIKKISKERVVLVMVAALLIGLSPIPSGLFSAYGEVDADRMRFDYAAEQGFRIAYLLEAAFFLYVILSNYHHISNKAKDIVMLNLSLVFCAILLVFVKSENGGRIGWMFMIGVMCTMSNMCVKHNRLLNNGVMMMLVSFFLFYRILDAWYFNLGPYKTFLTSGHTAAEWIYEDFEYNTYYDLDKFHRPAFWFMEK